MNMLIALIILPDELFQ